MWKIGRKTSTCPANTRSEQCIGSVKNALEVTRQDSMTCSTANQSCISTNSPQWRQMHDSAEYQLEAERKRALGIMHSDKNRFL